MPPMKVCIRYYYVRVESSFLFPVRFINVGRLSLEWTGKISHPRRYGAPFVAHNPAHPNGLPLLWRDSGSEKTANFN
jgi:hypothetical protein